MINQRLGGVGGSCLATLDLRWEMAPKSVSSMIFGVGLKLSRHLFQIRLPFPILRMLLWQTIWSFLEVPPVEYLFSQSGS